MSPSPPSRGLSFREHVGAHPQAEKCSRFQTDAGRDAELRIYPPGRHGAFYNQASRNLGLQLQSDFLGRYLKGGAASANPAP